MEPMDVRTCSRASFGDFGRGDFGIEQHSAVVVVAAAAAPAQLMRARRAQSSQSVEAKEVQLQCAAIRLRVRLCCAFLSFFPLVLPLACEGE